MDLIYNDTTYITSDGSMFEDITIPVESLDEACGVVNALNGMNSFSLNGIEYTNMTVIRQTITITGEFRVNIKLRKKSEKEIMQEEIDALRTAMAELATTTNKTTSAKINKILQKGVAE